MPFVTPEEIAKKAERAYPKYLKQWIQDQHATFFPLRLPVNLKRDRKEPQATIVATERLLAKSKQRLGWGYTVHREQKATLDFGRNEFATSVTIDSEADLLRLAGKLTDFAGICEVAEKIRQEIPALETWIQDSVARLASLQEKCEGLLLVAKFFMANPWPDCYARQIPVRVDTKFVLRNHAILRQWLDMLPGIRMDVNETKFARRFGLRDGEPHRGIRVLDLGLLQELGLTFRELSLPLRSIAQLDVREATVFIVENDLNLQTLPGYSRAIGMRGVGDAVNRLERVAWLHSNRVLYWGDIDVEGFTILSRLRNLFPETESLLMNLDTLEANLEHAGEGNGAMPAPPTNLTESEQATFERCLRDNLRLEQEKVPQLYVEQIFRDMEERARLNASQ